MRAPSFAFVVILSASMLVQPASAETLCAPPVPGDVQILLGVRPFECYDVRDGQKVTWTNIDPLMERAPRDVNAGGFCFSAMWDAGAPIDIGESFSIALTWRADEDRFWVQVWNDAGEQVAERRCSSLLHTEHDGDVLIPWVGGLPAEVPRYLRMVG